MLGVSPFDRTPVFQIGPVPVTHQVLVTWGIMGFLALFSWLVTRRLRPEPGRLQAVFEVFVETVASQLRGVMHCEPARFVPLLGTLFLFLVTANLSGVLPGVEPPTGHLETPAALAIVVFFSVHYFGIGSVGLREHLRSYVRPNPLMLPLNVLSEITRTFSLMIRLFGNMLSHAVVLAIAVLIAGLLVPVAFMALGVLVGLIQAYIFSVLAAVFIGGAVQAHTPAKEVHRES